VTGDLGGHSSIALNVMLIFGYSGPDYGIGQNGTDITVSQAKTKSTYTDLGWQFGSSEANPWKMGVGNYPLPVFWWQTKEPVADITHLK